VPYAGFDQSDTREALQHGDPGGSVWRPGECDVSIRPGWFWHQDQDAKVRSVDNLVDLYFQSVGRNSLLLLNLPPNTEGLVSEPDVRAMAGFRERLAAIFKTDLAAGKPATASNTRDGDAAFGPQAAVDGKPETYWATDNDARSGWLEIDLGKPTALTIARLEEPITLGQRIAAYRIEYLDGNEWKTIVRGTTIGRKKLDRFAPVTARRVRLVIDKSLECPLVKTFGLY
jgi:alpha-L-fucosidase